MSCMQHPVSCPWCYILSPFFFRFFSPREEGGRYSWIFIVLSDLFWPALSTKCLFFLCSTEQ
uniref:Uncharacterized protein n=1 Tax=Rhizophora mucronata TaxID=61149 RepID=A0A2P2PDH3_RHIMU